MDKRAMLGMLVKLIDWFDQFTEGALQFICGPLKDAIEKFGGENGEMWLKAFGKFLRKENPWSESTILESISTEPLVLDPADGVEIIADTRGVFSYVDSDLRNWKADEPGQATGKTPVRVYEMVRDATFQQMFASLSSDAQKLCLTQSQIIGFVKKHRQWLRTDGYATFFLFKSYNQHFVASVHFRSDVGLSVSVVRFEHPCVWNGKDRYRVVVPRLA